MDPAKELILASFASGKPVVTANKELFSTGGKELFDAADDGPRRTSGSRPPWPGDPTDRLPQRIAGRRARLRMLGIVNGTTNYVLTQMSERAWTRRSRAGRGAAPRVRRGRSDAPTSTGFNAAAKCAILASIAFNTPVVASDVYREGIARGPGHRRRRPLTS